MRGRIVLAIVVAAVAGAGVLFVLRTKTAQEVSPPKTNRETNLIRASPEIPDTLDPQWLERLQRGDPLSVPEICRFLHTGKDAPLRFSGESPEWKRFPTARTLCLANLSEIGGKDAADCAHDVAFTTRDPLELALAARILEEIEPKQHRERLVAAVRQLLSYNPSDPAPLLQLLAFYHVADAIPDIEKIARLNWQAAGSAIAALTLLRRDGGEAALLNLWRESDLPAKTRSNLAHAIGVCAAQSEPAQAELKQMLASETIDPSFKHEALTGLANGESYIDARLLPRGSVVMALPQSRWLTARLIVLDAIEPAAHDRATAKRLQQVRDDLIAQLERTQ